MQFFFKSIAVASLALFALPAGSEVCDVDTDGDVDRLDIRLITDARNQTADPGDPRDADGDGVITLTDSRTCVAQCSLPRCRISTIDGALIWDQGNWDEEDWQ